MFPWRFGVRPWVLARPLTFCSTLFKVSECRLQSWGASGIGTSRMDFRYFLPTATPKRWKPRPHGRDRQIFAAMATMPATGRRLCVALLVCLGLRGVHRGLLTFCPGQSPPGAGQAQTRGGLMMRHADALLWFFVVASGSYTSGDHRRHI